MSDHIVRCPHCDTRFRAQQEQLQAAGGQLRCGHCLRVFHAGDATLPDASVHSDTPVAESAEHPQRALWELIDDEPASEPEDQSQLFTLLNDSGPGQDRSDPATLQQLNSLSDPLPLSAGRPTINRWRLLGGSALALLLCLSLAAQYVWHHRLAWSQDPERRPWLEALCQNVLPCTLPPLHDLSELRSENLQLRNHPQDEGALLLSLTLRNEAPFAQAFPDLELRIRDLDNEVIASRRMPASEYLPEPLLQSLSPDLTASLFPAGNSVQIRRALADPGQDAVNYSIHFHPALPTQ